MFRKVITGILIVCFAISFSVMAFCAYIDTGNAPHIAFGSDNLTEWEFYSNYMADGVLEQYNRGGTNDVGIRFHRNNDNNTTMVLLRTYIDWVVAGKTYIITWDSFNYQSRLQLGMYVLPGTAVLDYGSNIPNPVLDSTVHFIPYNDSTNTDNSNGRYSYSFSVDENMYTEIGDQGLSLLLEISFVNSAGSGDGYLVMNNMQIVCLDDIILEVLYSVKSDTNAILSQTDIKDTVEEIRDLIKWALTTTSNDNVLANIRHNVALWFNDWAINSPETIRGWFYQEYGERFSIALYKMLSEVLGYDQNFEDEAGITDVVSEYKEIESGLMQDKSSDVNAALSMGDAALNNSSFGFIKNTLQAVVFDNAKITAYILFALSMGLVVLVLGRKIHL